MNNSKSFLEKSLSNDRLIVLAGIAIVSVIAWMHMAGMTFESGSLLSHHSGHHWSASTLLSHFIMWIVMMVAMMLPTAGPMILTFATISRGQKQKKQPYVNTFVFVFGYIIVSVGYSLLATFLQWWLYTHAMLTSLGASNSYILSGILLCVAGFYQWSNLKHACLRFCRNPFNFLMGNWREGGTGALYMGLKHGLLCTGCCWALMALMFVGGVMNLLWMVVITAIILIEKVAPKGDRFAKIAGVAMITGGIYFIAVNFI
jgi:predicted metal-binding membrane protein